MWKDDEARPAYYISGKKVVGKDGLDGMAGCRGDGDSMSKRSKNITEFVKQHNKTYKNCNMATKNVHGITG